MKFAKHQAKAIDVSEPEWHPFWINYNRCKKLLSRKRAESPDRRTTRRAVTTGSPATPSSTAVDPAAPTSSSAAVSARDSPAPAAHHPPFSSAASAQRMPTATTDAAAADADVAATVKEDIDEDKRGQQHHHHQHHQQNQQLPRRDTAASACSSGPSRTSLTEGSSSSTSSSAACRGGRSSHVEGVAGAAPETATAPCRRRETGGGTDGLQPPEVPRTKGETTGQATSLRATCCLHPASRCALGAVAAFSRPSPSAARTGGAGSIDGKRAGAGSVETTRELELRLDGRSSEEQQQQQQQAKCTCPFFGTLLPEILKCRVFFLQNEDELKARTFRLQFALNQLKKPELSRLSSVEGSHVKLMQACVNFYRDALLLEDFAMVNYTAVVKLLKKRDKLAGTSDKQFFLTEVMASEPFAMYPGVAERVAQVEQIFREIEDMCFLRTGSGMKSIMKTELNVVEAILQLAQESEDTQRRVVDDGLSPVSQAPWLQRRALLPRPAGEGGGGSATVKEESSSSAGVESATTGRAVVSERLSSTTPRQSVSSSSCSSRPSGGARRVTTYADALEAMGVGRRGRSSRIAAGSASSGWQEISTRSGLGAVHLHQLNPPSRSGRTPGSPRLGLARPGRRAATAGGGAAWARAEDDDSPSEEVDRDVGVSAGICPSSVSIRVSVRAPCSPSAPSAAAGAPAEVPLDRGSSQLGGEGEAAFSSAAAGSRWKPSTRVGKPSAGDKRTAASSPLGPLAGDSPKKVRVG